MYVVCMYLCMYICMFIYIYMTSKATVIILYYILDPAEFTCVVFKL